jgi:hypothetical protein
MMVRRVMQPSHGTSKHDYTMLSTFYTADLGALLLFTTVTRDDETDNAKAHN